MVKVSHGFVSNSSSSSSVVLLPSDWKVTNDQVKKMWHQSRSEKATPRDINKVKEALSSIANGGSYGECDGDAYSVLNALIPPQFCLATFETGPDNGQIQGITRQKIEQFLAQSELQNNAVAGDPPVSTEKTPVEKEEEDEAKSTDYSDSDSDEDNDSDEDVKAKEPKPTEKTGVAGKNSKAPTKAKNVEAVVSTTTTTTTPKDEDEEPKSTLPVKRPRTKS